MPLDHRLAVCSWSLLPDTPAQLLTALRETGLSSVQLALSPVVRDPAWAEAFVRLREAGIEIVSGMIETKGEDYSTLESIRHTGGLVPDEHWEINFAHIRDVASLAADQGLDLLTMHAGFLPEDSADPLHAVMIERLQAVADLLQRRGITLALETGQECAAALAAFLDRLGRGNVGVNFDPANMILYGQGDPVAAVEELAPRIRQLHIKDALPSDHPGQFGREMRVGRGAVDWPDFLAAARRIPRKVRLVIEREAGEDRIGDVRRAASTMDELLRG